MALPLLPVLRAAAVPLALVASGVLVLHGSSAAFSGTTTKPADSWAAGSVVLTDDDSGSAMFSITRLKPGSSDVKCLVVTSQATVASTLKLYATDVVTTNALSSWIDLVVKEGTGGSFGSCTGFTPAAVPAFTGTLDAFAGVSTFSNGVGAYALTGTPPETRTYQISYTVDAATPNTAQSGTASATFVWEAQS